MRASGVEGQNPKIRVPGRGGPKMGQNVQKRVFRYYYRRFARVNTCNLRVISRVPPRERVFNTPVGAFLDFVQNP